MKKFGFLVLLAVLLVSDYAFAQFCPCDALELQNGTTGNDIVELICPGGELGKDTVFESNGISVFIFDGDTGYEVEIFDESGVCEIGQEGGGNDGKKITLETALACKASLLARCGLNVNPIPTLSEWGMIAMAGVLGMIGLYVVARRRRAAA